MIVFADITMSTDNILAVAGASRGNAALIVFGLGLSIPLVVFSSTLLSRLMDRFPLLILVGAAILGKVGGEMVVTDPYVVSRLHPSHAAEYTTEALLAVAVVVVGKVWNARARAAETSASP
jgi:predicted tellurium resistance membrane protein TerC